MDKFLQSYGFFIDVAIYIVLLIAFYIALRKHFARSNILPMLIPTAIIAMVAVYFNFTLLLSLSIALTVALAVSIVISNDQKVNSILKRKVFRKKNTNVSEERKQLYKVINETVAMLSTSKTGAIMTFERKDSLDDYISKGVRVDAPVTKELLTTIFYEGTTLHDGAVVIRGNMIAAASVFYIPTVKPMNGKYGARHRASLGISEVCDAVTVVVSEETGRISLAIDGELQAVTRENFLATFKRQFEE